MEKPKPKPAASGSDSIERLAKVCGLLASSADGARATAALKATAMLNALGLTWRDLIERATREPAAASPQQHPPEKARTEWAEVIADIIRHAPDLNGYEENFLDNILESAQRGVEPSEKQRRWILQLKRRADKAAKAGHAGAK